MNKIKIFFKEIGLGLVEETVMADSLSLLYLGRM